WATELVPGAGIDHDEAAVGIFNHVRWVKVRIIRNDKIAVFGFKGSAVGLQNMTRDLMQIETTNKQVVPIIVPEDVRFIANDTARDGGAKLGHDRHQVTGLGVIVDDVVRLAVNA